MRTYTIIKRCDKCGEEIVISPEKRNAGDDINRIKDIWFGATYVEYGKPTLRVLDLCKYCRDKFFGEFSELTRRYGWSEFNNREVEYEGSQEIDDDW